jgi:hypothetical protein
MDSTFHFSLEESGGPARVALNAGGLTEPSLKRLSQIRRRLELRDRIQFLEGGCESIRQTPDCSGLELLIFALEAASVNRGPDAWELRVLPSVNAS